MFPFQPFAQLVTACICLLCGFKLWGSNHQPKSTLVHNFSNFFIFLGLFFFFLSFPAFISNFDSWYMGIGWIIAHVFFYIGLAYFIAIPASLYFPRIKKKVAAAVTIVLGYFFVLLNIIYFNYPVLEGRIIHWNIDRLVGIGEAGVGGLIGIIAGIFFLTGIKKSSSKKLKIRAALLGIGSLIVVIASGFLYYASIRPEIPTISVLLVGDILEIVGFLMIFWGVILGHDHKIESKE